jgi:hypothetical protein
VFPSLIFHSDAGPLSGGTAFVLAAHPGATAVVLHGYASALWTDTVADRTDEVAAALLTQLAEAERRVPIPPGLGSDGRRARILITFGGPSDALVRIFRVKSKRRDRD